MTGSHRVYRKQFLDGMPVIGVKPGILQFNYYPHISIMRKELDEGDNTAAVTIHCPDQPVTVCLARDLLSLQTVVHEAFHATIALERRDHDEKDPMLLDWREEKEAALLEHITAWLLRTITDNGISAMPCAPDGLQLAFRNTLTILMKEAKQ